MKYFLFIYFLFCSTLYLFSQKLASQPQNTSGKPVLDTSTFRKWLSIDGNSAISNDGRYVFYGVREDKMLPRTLTVKAIDGNWSTDIVDVEDGSFTTDSRKVIFMKGGDSLCLLSLGEDNIEYVRNVASFKLFKQGDIEYLAYQSNTSKKRLTIRNLRTEKEQSFTEVARYLISPSGSSLILEIEEENDSVTVRSLIWINLIDGKRSVVWKGKNISNLTLDDHDTQLAFVVGDTVSGRTEKSYWCYNNRTGETVQLVNNQSYGINGELRVDGILSFCKDGSKLFVSLKEDEIESPKPGAVKVDVWSYTDAKLQSQQLAELDAKSYMAVIHLADHRIMRLQLEGDFIGKQTDDIVYMTNTKRDVFHREGYWNSASKEVPYVTYVDSSKRKRLDAANIRSPRLSIDGRYLVGIDDKWTDLYSYELTTGITRNITKSLPIPVTDMLLRDSFDEPFFEQYRGFQFAAWLTNERHVLVYDDFDIWIVDPGGEKAAVNLTKGYGRKNKIVFRLLNIYTEKNIFAGRPLIVSAFDKRSKNSGFYKIAWDKDTNPEKLVMGPYQYNSDFGEVFPVKAENTEIYLIKRESATESPNLFWTRDFKTFTKITDICPEKNFNWLTSELRRFETLDGRTEQGVLYKPENFDPKRKYPVIVHYYERKSQDLNRYHRPFRITGGELDIPWFTSRGYLVFTPDIHYTTGKTGQSAYNSVVAAAIYLAKFAWVNAKRIGIQGHSFGGYETNYIVGHTNIFAAAVSSSGPNDWISLWGGTKQSFVEREQPRFGVTLWEGLELYIRNSPIFSANKITTPMLTVSNKKDLVVPFSQGLELFMALRRLGKRVWMLQYDDGYHGVINGDYIDYVMRMTQFFDHYLKGAPAPRWMLEGIPARLKGVDNGLELDTTGREPGRGLLIDTLAKHQTKNLRAGR